MKAIIILGSHKDDGHRQRITSELDTVGVKYDVHVASAHREGKKLMEILDSYKDQRVIYVTVAGKSNALSGFVAGNTNKITIACPPFVDRADMMINIHSTVQMPAGVPAMTILDPVNVALAIKRIIDG